MRLAWFLVVLLFAGILVMDIAARKMLNVGIPDILANFPFPDVEIRKSVGKFERSYPATIKGLWEPSPIHFTKAVRDERLKELGVNTVSVSVEYEFDKEGRLHLKSGEEELISNIIRAKRAGFAVLVAPNFVGPGGYNFVEEGIPVTKEKYLQVSREVALKWADISERYGVEFFAPQNELDVTVRQFCEDGELTRLVESWHREVLPELRELFHGKLVAKLADSYPELNLSGYDYVGVTVYHGNLGLEEFRNFVRGEYSRLVSSSRVSGADCLVTEVWLPYGGPFYSFTESREGVSLDELQDDYFRISIEELPSSCKGYVFMAWTMPGMDVRGRPAEQVLREFFGSI